MAEPEFFPPSQRPLGWEPGYRRVNCGRCGRLTRGDEWAKDASLSSQRIRVCRGCAASISEHREAEILTERERTFREAHQKYMAERALAKNKGAMYYDMRTRRTWP